MPPRRRANQRGYVRLERRLSLLAWLHQLLGYGDTRELLGDIKHVNEGLNEEGRSYVSLHLESRSQRFSGLTVPDLLRYDGNIRDHLTAMNRGRVEPITLRYFQYLAALYTEMYLDWHCNRTVHLLPTLNRFVAEHNQRSTTDDRWEHFSPEELSKLAFWMATGSGKTLLLHLHYRQFMHYNKDPLDNILLVTPNEGLSQQHLDELHASGIPATRFDQNEPVSLLHSGATVKVTEITKLTLDKRGEGASIPVEALEGNNLIFVDEGHKGSGGEAWRSVREKLAETGFTFEYSATFGQALAAANNDGLLTEYGKCIAFDYSYRHFYQDGYGKDFHILNLQQESAEDQTDLLMMGNLLSFYQQQLVFDEKSVELRPYNIERPLWAFIGSSVNAVRREEGRSRSDVLTVTQFLNRVLSNPNWTCAAINRLLGEQSGLTNTETGKDVFAGRFNRLSDLARTSEEIYLDLLDKVMHVRSSDGLQLVDLQGCDGELGIKAAGADDYFGVIYVGDKSRFKGLADADESGITLTEDAFHGSLFDRINEADSTVEMLVGSRKFIEGWSSWRVSNMGLLNIGRSEGSQIIQMFGRGVRLKGRRTSLKRSSAIDRGPHPDNIRILETLDIFALRANYMVQFREYLENEGIDTREPVQIPLTIRPNEEFLNRDLVIPRLDEGKDFIQEEIVPLKFDPSVNPVSVVASATAQQIVSGAGDPIPSTVSSGTVRTIPPENLNLVDWGHAYQGVLEHKQSKGLDNMLVRSEDLRSILEAGDAAYRLVADESVVCPKKWEDRERLQEAVIGILRSYADALHRRRKTAWESKNLSYRKLDKHDPNLRFNAGSGDSAGSYTVSVPRHDANLVQEVEKLIEECNELYHDETDDLPRIHFDRHLYQPLLIENDQMTSSPPGLQDSERSFVEDLRSYWATHGEQLTKDWELFLLRNLSRGTGVGFYESEGFYPDFIMWIKSANHQRIVFIEPHGLLNARAYVHDSKARLHERLPDLASEIATRSPYKNVELDSFIVSATPYDEVVERYGDGTWSYRDFASKHILFPEPNDEYNYIAEILRQ